MGPSGSPSPPAARRTEVQGASGFEPPISSAMRLSALDHVMPRGGEHAGFPCCCPPQVRCPQDGPGCATPTGGDPYRIRTCVRCVRGSRPAVGRTGHGVSPAEGGGSEPRASRPPVWPVHHPGVTPVRRTAERRVRGSNPYFRCWRSLHLSRIYLGPTKQAFG